MKAFLYIKKILFAIVVFIIPTLLILHYLLQFQWDVEYIDTYIIEESDHYAYGFPFPSEAYYEPISSSGESHINRFFYWTNGLIKLIAAILIYWFLLKKIKLKKIKHKIILSVIVTTISTILGLIWILFNTLFSWPEYDFEYAKILDFHYLHFQWFFQ